MTYVDGKDTKDQQVEDVTERRKSVNEQIVDLSGIEATATSKAAWLISITVSIGGFLFGKLSQEYHQDVS
jgi:SP family myo-inositol transporter-like MFS transporter 13